MIDIVCNQGVYTQELSNFDILNKLKEIHEKIKRLNKTYSDPKFGRILNNRTMLFLDKNTKKFFNMTNSFSKKISKGNEPSRKEPVASTLGYKQKTSTTAAFKDLEQEIEQFFASNDLQLTNQIDEMEKKNKIFKSKTGKGV